MFYATQVFYVIVRFSRSCTMAIFHTINKDTLEAIKTSAY